MIFETGESVVGDWLALGLHHLVEVGRDRPFIDHGLPAESLDICANRFCQDLPDQRRDQFEIAGGEKQEGDGQRKDDRGLLVSDLVGVHLLQDERVDA